MNVWPSKHLILINGHTYQGLWFEGNSQLCFADPFTLTECWSNYFNNQIIDVAHNLWKSYHFMGSTDRISVFGPRPYSNAVAHLRVANHCNPIKLLILLILKLVVEILVVMLLTLLILLLRVKKMKN